MDVNQAFQFFQEACDLSNKKEHLRAYEKFVAAVNLAPDVAEYRINLALAAQALALEAEKYNEIAYQQASEAAKLSPDNAITWVAFGQVAMNCYRLREAIVAYERALELDPRDARTWHMLSYCHMKFAHDDKAVQCSLKSLELDPENGDAHFLLAGMLHGKNFNNSALAYHAEKSFSVKKKTLCAMDGMWNAAHGFLGIGVYEKGWGYFESRHFRCQSNAGQQLLSERFKQPQWDGQEDCTICVIPEMGFGDVFVMLRYLDIIKSKHNVRIMFEANEAYADLVADNFPYLRMVKNAEGHDFDYYAPLMSMPRIFKTRRDNVPWEGQYIFPQKELVEEWYPKLMGWCEPGRPNIGICWSSGANTFNPNNFFVHQKKSVPFDKIHPLFECKNVNWISLQTGMEAKNIYGAPEIKTFSDTAAILSMLDGLVTVDTAVCNLAGAMGVKTWLMDRYDHDWRYFDGLKTPWFPTVKPIRQKGFGEWGPVIQTIVNEISALSSKVAA